jgi:branched-chain amino acid aminotransferase
VGTSNLFFYWKNEMGEDEIITPPADDCILHGVTRDSVIVCLI